MQEASMKVQEESVAFIDVIDMGNSII